LTCMDDILVFVNLIPLWNYIAMASEVFGLGQSGDTVRQITRVAAMITMVAIVAAREAIYRGYQVNINSVEPAVLGRSSALAELFPPNNLPLRFLVRRIQGLRKAIVMVSRLAKGRRPRRRPEWATCERTCQPWLNSFPT
jgi:hypothetical protein